MGHARKDATSLLAVPGTEVHEHSERNWPGAAG
jgi:hypothetical protein